jgi:hypothetical protein
MLGYLQQIWGLSTYFEAIKYWHVKYEAKTQVEDTKKRKEKDTVRWTDSINIASVGAIVGRVGTLVKP